MLTFACQIIVPMYDKLYHFIRAIIMYKYIVIQIEQVNFYLQYKNLIEKNYA